MLVLLKLHHLQPRPYHNQQGIPVVKKRNLAFNNWNWSEATELKLSDSMSIVSGSKLEFRVLLLAAGRKPEHPGEKP